MKFYSIFRAEETIELAGGNLNFRLWPMFANDVIAIKSLKPAQFILLWSGHSSGSFGAVLSDKWAGGREEFWVLGERTGQSNLRSRIFFLLLPPPPPLPAPACPIPSLTTANQRKMETILPHIVLLYWLLGEQFPFWFSHLLFIFYSLFTGNLFCARVWGMIQIWPRTYPWGAHFISL